MSAPARSHPVHPGPREATRERVGRRRVPAWLALDRFDAGVLAAFSAMSLVVLAALATRPLTMTGVDSGVPSDQLQYFAWIRSASEHGVIRNLWDIAPPGTSYFVHPGFLLSGLLHKAGLSIAASYHLLWKPVAIVVLFFGFRAYVRRLLPPGRQRRAALVIALFYVSPFAALIGFAHPSPSRLRGQLDFMSGEMFPGLYMWGYMMTAIAVGLLPLALLAVERARVPERRTPGRGARWYAGWAGLASLVIAWLQPWQSMALVGTVAVVELMRWRRGGRPRWRPAAAQLGPLLLGAALPAAYYWWMSRVDPSWKLAAIANLDRVGNWPWYAWVLGLLPIAVPAWLGFRRPAGDWQEIALRALPLVLFAEYWLIFASRIGTFPFHALQGASLPLAILAVGGVASRSWPAALRRPAVVWGLVLLLTLPGVLHKLNNTRQEVHKGGEPYFLKPGEEAGLRWLERDPRPGGVMAPIYSGLVVPSYTGRAAWVGQISWTRDYDERVRLGNRLFEGRLARAPALRLVAGARVPFLFQDCFHHGDVARLLRGYLTEVRRFGCASVYVVDRAKLDAAIGGA